MFGKVVAIAAAAEAVAAVDLIEAVEYTVQGPDTVVAVAVAAELVEKQ